ncbi:MAG TPA: hypothetical protein VGC06_06980 [Actinomycetes bacterium]
MGSGLASDPRVRAVGAAALLLGALVLTGRLANFDHADTTRPSSSAPISTQTPYRSGDEPQCPPNWPVLAMTNHVSYPSGNPTRPPAGATEVACYHTPADAAGAGYPPASPPPGVLEVGGVYLTPTSEAFQRDCQTVADRLGTMVPCPRLLPAMPPGFPPPRLCTEEDQCRRGEPLLFTQNEFVVPFGYVGAPGGYGALGIVAAPTPERDGEPTIQCRRELQPITRTVLGAQAVLASCADEPSASLFGGMDLLRWPKEGTRVVVAILGHSELNLRLAATLADHLWLVEARRPG